MPDLSSLHSLVFNALDEQLAVIDDNGLIVEVNRAWIQFGLDNGMSPSHLWVGQDYLDALRQAAQDGEDSASQALQGIHEVQTGLRLSYHLEYPCHSPQEQRWFVMEAQSLAPALPGHCLLAHTNITSRRLAELQAEHLARHDPLTGLANRRGFHCTLERVLRRNAREGRELSLIAVDLDFFKEYNDRLGHQSGDDALVRIGLALQSFCRRPDDLAARLGGDEFMLLFGDAQPRHTRQVAQSIVQEVNDLQLAYGRTGQVTVSVGVVSAVPSAEEPDGRALLSEVDRALYEAKRNGKNTVVVRYPGPDKRLATAQGA